MKKTKRLALHSETIRRLEHVQLVRVAGGLDTVECGYDQDPGPVTGPTNHPQYCSLIATVCGCVP